MVVREPIVATDDDAMRVVWSAEAPALQHYNGAAQVIAGAGWHTRIAWTADFLSDAAAATIDPMMEQGRAVMKTTLDALARAPAG